MEVVFIFPHQLLQKHPALAKDREVYLIEDDLFFTQYAFHKQKLILHRASMKWYAEKLQQQYPVHYIEHTTADLSLLFKELKKRKITHVHLADPVDYLLMRRLTRYSKANNIHLVVYPTPGFLTTDQQLAEVFRGEKKYLMASFYTKQRKRLDILIENDAPVGGQWSFDAENRKRIPKGLKLPEVYKPAENIYVQEGVAYVEKQFGNNPGSTEVFHYPVTFAEAEKVLEDFLTYRLHDFGAYEDAIVKQESVLFHSVLTPALNIGLLTPQQILDKTFEFHRSKKYPLNSLEGFVRQIIGWREFIRGVYQREGVKQRTTNALGYSRKIPASFYKGTTGVEPIDQTIKKVLQTGYCHHIERLMVLGNFMHLCEFDPDEVYRWFMELFIDAYDWVMVPNVYGMTQYADGGLMTTKPYVSGSNYVLKMSDYTKGPWCEVWDGLYWRYIDNNKELFAKNPRMSMIVNLAKKMDPKKLKAHHTQADQFLNSL